MKRNITFIGLAVAGLCAFLFWRSYGRFWGQFVDGRYVDPETGRAYVERAGLMWAVLGVVALVMVVLVRRK